MNGRKRKQCDITEEGCETTPERPNKRKAKATNLLPPMHPGVTVETRHDVACHYITQEYEAKKELVQKVIEWKFERNPWVLPSGKLDGGSYSGRSTSTSKYCSPHLCDGSTHHIVEWENIRVNDVEFTDHETERIVFGTRRKNAGQKGFVDCELVGYADVTLIGSVYSSEVIEDFPFDENTIEKLKNMDASGSCAKSPTVWYGLYRDGNRRYVKIFKGKTIEYTESLRIPFKVAIEVKVTGESFGPIKRQINTYSSKLGPLYYYVLASEFDILGTSLKDYNKAGIYYFRLDDKFDAWAKSRAQEIAVPNLRH